MIPTVQLLTSYCARCLQETSVVESELASIQKKIPDINAENRCAKASCNWSLSHHSPDSASYPCSILVEQLLSMQEANAESATS